MTISIEPLSGDFGVAIEDRIEQRRCELLTSGPVSPVSVTTERLDYPIDRAVSIEASGLTVTEASNAYLRDEAGQIVSEVEPFSSEEFGPGTFTLEIHAPIKLYVEVEGPGTVSLQAVEVSVTSREATPTLVGVRSFHQHPAATIETTSDPEDVMQAISYLSSSVKTTTAERAFPTLRGHPPELKVSDELNVPDQLDVPETGIHLEVPADLGATFVVAPLAYYLGARVRRGDIPRIVTDQGWSYRFDTPIGFEMEVERALKQSFFLDCLVRTEGFYRVPMHEKNELADSLDLDFPALYQADPAIQLERYLSVPFERIDEFVPQWKMTAHVEPRVESIGVVPFLVDDLAVIRTPSPSNEPAQPTQLEAIEEFARRGMVRGASRRAEGKPLGPTHDLVEPEQTNSIEQTWVGEGIPVGASKAVPEAFRNRLARRETEGGVEIVVVCNDAEMLDEHDTASEVYQSREELPFDVTLYDDLTTDRLRLVLESEIDYFHYIGHIEDEGFRCSDGLLDVSTLDDVRLDTFFLNACHSYDQGRALIEQGAIGGVVTLDEVINSGAVRVGKAMARLLNRGFPLRAALSIASKRSIVGGQYIVVGDGNMDIAHSESLVPNLLQVSKLDDHQFELHYRSYYSAQGGLGALILPLINGNEENYLVGSGLSRFLVSQAELSEFLEMEVVPVDVNGQVTWSDQVDVSKI